MRFLPVLLLVLLAACGRPLTEAETRFAEDLFGDSLDTSKVRVRATPNPPPLFSETDQVTVLRGTERACVRVPQPAGAQPPRALAWKNDMVFTGGLQGRDMAFAWPAYLRFPQAVILAHELTHVWQWQNRAWTGYTPWAAAAESLALPDPYYSASGEAPIFFAYGFEQQAAIVEDFVCFSVANPTHPRRAELREILAPVFPVERFEAAIARGREMRRDLRTTDPAP